MFYDAIGPKSTHFKLLPYLKERGPDGKSFLSSLLGNVLVSDKINEIPNIFELGTACLNPHRLCTASLVGDPFSYRGIDKQKELSNVVFNILIKIKVVLDDGFVIIPLQFDRGRFIEKSSIRKESVSEDSVIEESIS